MNRHRKSSPKPPDARERPPRSEGTGREPRGTAGSRGRGPLVPVEPVRLCPRCGSAARLGPLAGVLVTATAHYTCRLCSCCFWVVLGSTPGRRERGPDLTPD
jgi:hypothetical protein